MINKPGAYYKCYNDSKSFNLAGEDGWKK
jgi:hypothetical protein